MHQEKSRLAEFAFVLGLVLVFALASPRIVRSLKHANSDFFSFWLAGRMVWEDQDPYDSDLWIDGHQANGAEWVSDDTFIYPLPLSLAFAPIGLLRMFGAYSLWMFLSLLAVVGSLVLLGVIWTRQSLGLSEMIPIFLGVLLFRPFLVTVRNGQLGAFLVLLLVVVLVLWEREQWLSGGMVLGAILLKPNLGVPISAFLILLILLAVFIRFRHSLRPRIALSLIVPAALFVTPYL